MELANVYRVALMVPAQGHPYDLDNIKIYDNLPEALTYFNELEPEAIKQSKYWGDNEVSILLEDMYNDAPAYPIRERKFVEGKEVLEEDADE